MAKMKKDELESLLGRYQNSAVGAFNSGISQHRADLFGLYMGDPYGDEVADRSKVVDTSIRDTLESIKPELMDIFLGGDAVVQFSPVGDEDVDAAEQETEVCNHVFLQLNDGFMVLYNWFTDALMLKVGYVKRYWDERKWIEIEEYDDLSPEETASLLQDLESTSDEIEFLERSGGIDEEAGTVEPLYLKIRRTQTEKRYVVESVPPDEILISPQWKSVSIKGCPFVAHRQWITLSDLIEMGFDRKQVEALPSDSKDTVEHEERFSGKFFNETDPDADGAMQQVLVYENYVRADYDGDGIAEQLQVFTAGSKGEVLKRNGKLAVEQVTDNCFEALCPLPIPHKHFGLSVAELVQDLQRIKTVLSRQLLDNLRISNNADMYLDEDQASPETYKDLAITQAGGRVIRGNGPNAVTPIPTVDTSSGSLAAIQYIDGLREQRTGVSRMNQGLDPNAISDLAQNTVKSLMTAAQKKILLIARIFAETGVRSLFLSMHRDLRSGPMREIAVKLNNKWTPVNPRTWKARADMTVNVGLGTGDRDIQFARLGAILEQQKEGVGMGIVGYDHIHHTLRKMTELAGFKDVGAFWPDPKEVAKSQEAASQQPQQPDPSMMLVEIEKMKAEGKAQSDMQANQIKGLEAMTKRLEVLLKDDRERDIKEAELGVKLESDAAALLQRTVKQ